MKKLFFILFSILAMAVIAFANDAPHANNDVVCDNCHTTAGTGFAPSPFWGDTTWDPNANGGIEHTKMNELCWGCHMPGNIPGDHSATSAMYVRTHSSNATQSTRWGTWSTECVVCHNPHNQTQYIYNRTSANTKLAQGTIGAITYLGTGTGMPLTEFNYTLTSWKTGYSSPSSWYAKSTGSGLGKERGTIIFLDSDNTNIYSYIVHAADGSKITVRGDLSWSTVSNLVGKKFTVSYGQAVKDRIWVTRGGKTDPVTFTYPKTGPYKNVTFLDKTGNNSFGDNFAAPHNGICQVCHTQTKYWRNDGTTDAPHNAGANCTTCHSHLEGFRAAGCDTCHGYPPVDTATLIYADKNNNAVTSSSAGPGAHAKHVAKYAGCNNCHTGGMTSAATGNDKIDIGFYLNGNLGGTYDGDWSTVTKPVFPITSGAGSITTITNGNTRVCSNLYCHSAGQGSTGGALVSGDYRTPTWATVAINCGSCHVDMSSSGSATGSHIKHAQSPNNIACAVCHLGYTSASAGSSHVDRLINLWFTGPAAGTTYSQGNTHNPGIGYGSCTSICHNDGTDTNAKLTPLWGTSVAACTACHAAAPSTGSHSTHLAVSGINCGKCHGDAVQGTTAPTGVHLNAKVNVYDVTAGDFGANYGAAGKDRGTAYSTCLSINCHGESSPTWGAGWGTYDNCTVCHGEKTAGADGSTIAGSNPEKVAPGGTGTDTGGNSAANSPRVGAHQVHLTAADGYTTKVLCSECHTVPGGFSSIGHIDATLAWDGHATVDFPTSWGSNRARMNGANPSYNSTTGECSGVYCHGSNMWYSSTNGTGKVPVWTNTLYLSGTPSTSGDCGTCHGAPPTGYAPTSHTGSETLNQCAGCHSHFNSDGTVKPASIALHMDGTVQAAACTSCHGQPPVSSVTLIGKDSWGTTWTSHSQGAHQAHWTVYSGSGCGICHAGGGVSDTGHMTGRQITMGFTYGWSSGTFNTTPMWNSFSASSGDAGTTVNNSAAAISCSGIYCHGSSMGGNGGTTQTPNWTSSGTGACGTCHGATAASAPTLGKHATHASSGSGYSFSCNLCHPAATTGAHVNANVSWNMWTSDARTSGSTYKGLASGSTGAIAPSASYGNCATLYCHSNANPAGGTNSYTTISWSAGSQNCGTCHKTSDTAANMQAAGNPQPMSEPHIKHISSDNYGQNAIFSCNSCHSDTASDNSTISDKTKHVDGSKNVVFNATVGGSWSPMQCTNTYCHSNGQASSGTHAAMTWTSSGSLSCSSCHLGGLSIYSNAHNKHLYVQNSDKVGRNISCGDCHYVTSTSNAGPVNKVTHVNKLVNIRFDDTAVVHDTDAPTYNGSSTTGSGMTKAPGLATGDCSNVYCHSVGNLSDATGSGTVVAVWGTTFRSITWNSTNPLNCDGCHGGGGKAHPWYTTGAPGSTTANSHVKHVESSSYGCDYCHINTTTDSAVPPTTVTGLGEHLDRIESVSFKSNGGQTGSYNQTAKTCSATYCHGSGNSPAWGSTTSCTSCHDATGTTLTLRHNIHYNSSTVPTTLAGGTNAHTADQYVYACLQCHPTGSHAKGSWNSIADAEVTGSMITWYTVGSSYTTDARNFKYSVTGNCGTLCHTKDGATIGTAVAGMTNWGSTATGSCGVCHNKQGDAAPTWSTAHSKHVNTYASNTNISCNSCHSGTALSYTTINGATGRNQHPNQTKDVALNTWASGAGANWSGTNCSNTYCHSDGTSLNGGTHGALTWTTTQSCTACHGGATAGKALSSAHAAHVNDTGNKVGFSIACQECHTATTSDGSTIASVSNHVNKLVNVRFDDGTRNKNADSPTYSGMTAATTAPNGAWKTVGATAGACNNVYCHSSGNVNGQTTPTIWSNIAWSTTLDCGGCHGDSATKRSHPIYATGTAGSATANSHVKHVENNAYSCDKCHVATVAGSWTTVGAWSTVIAGGSHLNRVDNVDFALNGGKWGSYNSAAKTCQSTYCHGSGQSLAWGSTTNCASCHDATGSGLSLRHDKHYNSSTIPTTLAGGTNAHTADQYVYACLQCHPTTSHATGPWNNNSDAWVTGPKISWFTSATSSLNDGKGFKYSNTGNCGTLCHTKDGATLGTAVAGMTNWGSTATGSCGVCHNKQGDAAPTWSTAHSKHVNTYASNTNISCNSCHSGTALSYTTINGATGRNQHPNQTKDVALNTWASGAGANWNGTNCSNTYCHSNGTSLNGGTHSAIAWNTTFGCTSCHGGSATWTTSGATAATGSHWAHVVNNGYACNFCHSATTTNGTSISGFSYHVDKNATVSVWSTYSSAGTTYNGQAAHWNTIYSKTVGTATGTCNTTYCHGGNSGNWGTVNYGEAQCVTCHGVSGTTAAQYTSQPNTAAPGWNTMGVNTSGTVGAITNNVSADSKVGAHDSHLRIIKGYTTVGRVECNDCHNVTSLSSAGHMDGSTTFVWSSFARNAGNNNPKWTTAAITPSYANGNCATNYCHGGTAPSNIRGTGWTSISWTNSSYLTTSAGSKTDADCNRCHATPPTASTIYDHSTMTLSTDCAQCHNHNGTGREHIDGTLYGAGTCNTCHWYDTSDAGAWTTVKTSSGGLWNSTNAWGAHIKHINHMKTRYGGTLVATSDTYSAASVSASVKSICGVCHSQQGTDHMNGLRQIIWNTTSHQYGSNALSWNTVSRTCSNLDCHYKSSPVW